MVVIRPSAFIFQLLEKDTAFFSPLLSFVATGGHPVWIPDKGWVKVRDLQKFYIIEPLNNNAWYQALNIVEKATTETAKQDIGRNQEDLEACTEKYGNSITEKFLKDIMSTTRTETSQTTTLKIYNWLHPKNILNYIGRKKDKGKQKDGWRKSGHLQKNGIGLKRAGNGIVNIGITLLEKLKEGLRRTVWFAEASLKTILFTNYRNFAAIHVNQNIEDYIDWTTNSDLVYGAGNRSTSTNITEQNTVHVAALTKLCGERRKVYNITVEDMHEYYANGVLVSNCDSLRYSIEHKIRGGMVIGSIKRPSGGKNYE